MDSIPFFDAVVEFLLHTPTSFSHPGGGRWLCVCVCVQRLCLHCLRDHSWPFADGRSSISVLEWKKKGRKPDTGKEEERRGGKEEKEGEATKKEIHSQTCKCSDVISPEVQ